MDNDPNPLQPRDEEVSPTTTDQTYHSTLEELDPSIQSHEEEMKKELTPAHPHDPPLLPNSPYSPGSPYNCGPSPLPQRPNSPPHRHNPPTQRPNPPTQPGPPYRRGGKIYPDHDTPIRNMPRSTEQKHLLTRALPRVGFQWAPREEIACVEEVL